MNRAQAGFTLIEILVVVVILAVMTSAASIGFGRSDQQRFNSTVEQSQQWFEHISTEAILSGSMWGVTVKKQEMRAYVWNGQEWLESEDNAPYLLPENMSYTHPVVSNEITGKLSPHFTLFPTGQIMPPEDILISDNENRALLTWKKSFSPEVVYQ